MTFLIHSEAQNEFIFLAEYVNYFGHILLGHSILWVEMTICFLINANKDYVSCLKTVYTIIDYIYFS